MLSCACFIGSCQMLGKHHGAVFYVIPPSVEPSTSLLLSIPSTTEYTTMGTLIISGVVGFKLTGRGFKSTPPKRDRGGGALILGAGD